MKIAALEWLTYGIGRLDAAAKERGVTVDLLTCDPSVYHYELSRNGEMSNVAIVDVDTKSQDAVAAFLRSQKDLRGLISTTDTWSEMAVRLWKQFGFHGTNPQGVLNARNKVDMRRRLHDAGLSSTMSRVVTEEELVNDGLSTIAKPFVLKDTAGTGSRNVWLILDEDDAQVCLDSLDTSTVRGELAVEPLLCGPLYSVETLSWDGDTRVLGVTSRTLSAPPTCREESLSFPVEFAPEVRLALDQWIAEVLGALQFDYGFAHTEFICTRGGFEVVEVNPRLGGELIGEAMCRSLGINIYECFIDMALGQRPKLMDASLNPSAAWAQLLVYARSAGRFDGISGEDVLSLHPGKPELFVSKRVGHAISGTDDFGGIVANVLATGPNSEIALHNAQSAGSKLRARVSETDTNFD